MAGYTSPKTMRLRGFIGAQEVIIFIDPRANHNFISSALVSRLRLPIIDTMAYGVVMGMRDKVCGQGMCKGVTLQLQWIDIYDDFLPLRLGNSDIILGIQWLKTLGMTHIDWKQ